MQKTLPIFIVIVLIAAGGAFYGGIKYQQNTRQNFFGENLGGQNFRNLSPEERQDMLQKSGADLSARGGNRIGTGMTAGEIIAKDEQTITVKLQDRGSKIIFFSDSTDIAKSAKGTADDLAVGEQVIINGAQNQDGSIIAKSIQVR